ncbi:MAG: peptide-methionine (S)-S-oxide reductase MsrA [Puniceicoccaceae bacterium]
MQAESKTSSIVLGGGCFWCVEAVYERMEGITNVVSGYTGGHVKNPTYRAVCTGNTGHNEVVRIEFNSETISLEEILDYFWIAHDPTTLNRQGADVGTQYRSGIYFNSPEQEAAAQASMAKAQKEFADKIVTEIEPLGPFYEAEDYHQDYFENNPQAPYCRYVIAPKLKKLDP